MFAFETTQSRTLPVLFAAEPGTLGWVLIVFAVLLGLRFCFRSSRGARRSARAKNQACRPRRGFPWKAAVLVVLIIAAVRYSGHSRRDWWNTEEHIRALQEMTQQHGFPAIDQKDLWALRRAGASGAAKPRRTNDDQPTKARQTAAVVDRVVVKPLPPMPAPPKIPEPAVDNIVVPATAIGPSVARTVAEVRKLAGRALQHAREVYADTGDEAAALKALAALKFVSVDSPNKAAAEPVPESSAPEAAVTPSGAQAASPEPPEVAAAAAPPAVPEPEAPAVPSPPATAATTQPAPATPVAAEPAVRPLAPTRPASASAAPRALRPDGTNAAVRRESTAETPAERAKPGWLTHPSGREGDTYYETVVVERYASAADAEDALAKELQQRTGAYVERYLGEGSSKLFVVPPAFIHDRLVKDRYLETVDTSLGPMVNSYARLGFDSRARAYLQRLHRDAQAENRLLIVAGGAGSVLLVLGALFGYLKLDTLTRGYYTGRLQFATVAVILAIAVGTYVSMSYLGFPHGRGLEGAGAWTSKPSVPLLPLKMIDQPTG